MILPGHFYTMAFQTSSLLEIILLSLISQIIRSNLFQIMMIPLFFQPASLEQPFHSGSGLSIKLLLCSGARLGKSL